MRLLPPTRATAFAACGTAWLIASAAAAEPRLLPPELVESFTKSIQPLLINRCATGGCHAGHPGHEPLLGRRNAAGQIDRDLTLANIKALRRGAESPAKARERTAQLAVGHPAATSPPPLSTAQMNALRTWLVAACEADARPAAATAPPPNRFRDMLEAARNPPPLWPPPEEPKGIILPNEPPEAESP